MNVTNNQIYYTVKDNKVTVKTRGPATFDEVLQTTISGLIGVMMSLVSTAEKQEQDTIKQDLYDRFNVSASRALEIFAPEYELRPDLTSTAILQAENAILNKHARDRLKLVPKQKEE